MCVWGGRVILVSGLPFLLSLSYLTLSTGDSKGALAETRHRGMSGFVS